MTLKDDTQWLKNNAFKYVLTFIGNNEDAVTARH